jgi:hypothetical protein
MTQRECMGAERRSGPSGGSLLSRRLRAILSAALATGLLLAALGTARAGELGDYRCTDPARVYLGNPRLIRNPCVISADEVYRRIPEYQEILEKGLTDKDVRYHFLMRKATERFSKAVKEMARSKYDFVAERGAIEIAKAGVAAPPDETTAVISKLE